MGVLGIPERGEVGVPARSFNTAGPCRRETDYMLPPLERLPEAIGLVERQKYFVVHAPRQTGKTTTIEALARELTRSGRYAALAFSCQAAGAAGEDVALAQRRIEREVRTRAAIELPAELRPPEDIEDQVDPLRTALTAWARACPRPVVLFLDEIDALMGQSLVTVLSQLRAGHNDRPHAFPASVVLCGLRDVRDYKAASGGDPARLGSASPFNVAVKSFRLGDFTRDEVAKLYGQHTGETGQVFTAEGVEYAYVLTQGQPWLVNALANEAVAEMEVPAREAIGPRRLEVAKERLIRQRATHLDSLSSKLDEPRVRQVIEPIIAGDVLTGDDVYDDGLCYVRDLGLVTPGNPIQVANPIYREVILRVLAARIESNVTADPRSFVGDDGRLDVETLLNEFLTFWKQHGEVLLSRETYHEAAAQLVLMAFLHRIVNGGGFIDREYGIGRRRIDLCVRWPYLDDNGKRVMQREAMELKAWADRRSDPRNEGMDQLDAYLDRLDLSSGILMIFDRRSDALPPPERVRIEPERSPAGRSVTVVRL